MKVKLLAHTPNPELVVAAAAKLCYSPVGVDELMQGLTPEKAREFVQMLASMGHDSPTEHVSFTFAIEGVSRALLAQLTRHRIASYSVQSQRYVAFEHFEYITPPELEKDEAAKAQFDAVMQKEFESYRALADSLQKTHYARMLAEGSDEKTAARASLKQAIEDARFVLPNAASTKIICTMNTRSLNNFFDHRCCNRAQWEIQRLADEMLRLVCAVAPSLFVNAGAPCVHGNCPEGKMSCGKATEMREKYKNIKAGQ